MSSPTLTSGLFPTELLRDPVFESSARSNPAASRLTSPADTPQHLSESGPAQPPSSPGISFARDAATLALARPIAAPTSAGPDTVVFSSPPLRLLSELASTGLRQLAILLPALEQAVTVPSPLPVGHLAKAATAAARQIAEGHAALLAEGPDRIEAALSSEAGARDAAPHQASQLLRTLARQIGATSEPAAAENRASEMLRAIARQIGETSAASNRPAEAGVAPAHRWLDEAQRLIRRTDDALDQAAGQLRPLVAELPIIPPSVSWALTELNVAQTQLAATAFSLRTAAPAAFRTAGNWTLPAVFGLREKFTGAVTAVGFLVLSLVLWIADGTWSLVAGMVGIAASLYWAMRIVRATGSLSLDARR